MKNLFTNIRLWFIWVFNPIEVTPEFLSELIKSWWPEFDFVLLHTEVFGHSRYFFKLHFTTVHKFTHGMPVEKRETIEITLDSGNYIIHTRNTIDVVTSSNLIKFKKDISKRILDICI